MRVTFIHGIGNKPTADGLRANWVRALADDSLGPGLDLDYHDVGVEMVYWADCLYADPTTTGVAESFEAADVASAEDVDLAPLLLEPGPEGAFARALSVRMVDNAATEVASPVVQENLEVLPVPIAKRVMKRFVRDTHHYLFNVEFTPRPNQTYKIQDEIRTRTIAALQRAASDDAPHVLVTHSMGTVIGYDCLKRVTDCPKVDAFLTIGSPLGLDEIQDQFRPEWTARDGFPEKVSGRWVNIFDRFDLVSIGDPNLADDYRRDDVETVADVSVKNSGTWRHDISKYFSRQQLRREFADMIGLDFP